MEVAFKSIVKWPVSGPWIKAIHYMHLYYTNRDHMHFLFLLLESWPTMSLSSARTLASILVSVVLGLGSMVCTLLLKTRRCGSISYATENFDISDLHPWGIVPRTVDLHETCKLAHLL